MEVHIGCSEKLLDHLNTLMIVHCNFTDSTPNDFASKLSCKIVVNSFPATFRQVEPRMTMGYILTLLLLSGVL